MNLPEALTDRSTRIEVASLILAGIGLVIVLHLGLLAALLAGLLAHQCAQMLAARHAQVGISRFGGKVIALTILGSIFAVALTFGTVRLANMLTGTSEGVIPLMQLMANAIDSARLHFPPWAAQYLHYLPANMEELEQEAAGWLRAHAGALGNIGETLGKILIHIIIGMIIGGMVVLSDPTHGYSQGEGARPAGARDGNAHHPARPRVPPRGVRAGADLRAQHAADRHLPGGDPADVRRGPAAGEDHDRWSRSWSACCRCWATSSPTP